MKRGECITMEDEDIQVIIIDKEYNLSQEEVMRRTRTLISNNM